MGSETQCLVSYLSCTVQQTLSDNVDPESTVILTALSKHWHQHV